ncbi:MAG: 1-acyl-sn-glycerol-3-phosphate acyltransferase, partial [Candidatus Omnitrophica bacterium]|nr:1-acyl-sn-glycerol-3-phosphate acyltransferase [Candidatus Omnitrophota bacterium]
HPSPSINKSVGESLTIFPRERDMTCTILRVSWNFCLRAFLRIYFRLSIRGKENLPLGRSFVFIANHSSHLDAVCLSAALPISSINRIFSAAAKDCFFSSFFRSLFSVIFVNALPFDRQHQHKKSLELCADVLNVSDQVLIIFPEGVRSLTGEIQTFKPGIGLLVAGTDRLVVPAYIDGAHQAWSKGSKVPKQKSVRVLIGKPMVFKDVERDKKGYEKVAWFCQTAVQKLKPVSIGGGHS